MNRTKQYVSTELQRVLDHHIASDCKYKSMRIRVASVNSDDSEGTKALTIPASVVAELISIIETRTN